MKFMGWIQMEVASTGLLVVETFRIFKMCSIAKHLIHTLTCNETQESDTTNDISLN